MLNCSTIVFSGFLVLVMLGGIKCIQSSTTLLLCAIRKNDTKT